MPSVVVAREKIRVGTPVVVEGPAPASSYGAVFEDDGLTAYFYGLDGNQPGNRIVDALHIYNVDSVADKEVPSEIEIAWSSDSRKAVLLINRYPHAVFDVEARRGYCRTGFPPADRTWTEYSHEWSDAAVDLLK